MWEDQEFQLPNKTPVSHLTTALPLIERNAASVSKCPGSIALPHTSASTFPEQAFTRRLDTLSRRPSPATVLTRSKMYQISDQPSIITTPLFSPELPRAAAATSSHVPTRRHTNPSNSLAQCAGAVITILMSGMDSEQFRNGAAHKQSKLRAIMALTASRSMRSIYLTFEHKKQQRKRVAGA